MTFKEAYDHGTEQLKQSGIRDAKGDSFYLLEHVTGINRGQYYAIHHQEMPQEEQEVYFALIQRRCMRMPLQHLIGSTEFMGLPFKVSPDVLIPRQDTECLVENALAWMKQALRCEEVSGQSKGETPQKKFQELNQRETEIEEYRILDMCTGSGCILISILYHANKAFGAKEFRKTKGVGVDISSKALALAKENAKKNGLCGTTNRESQVTFIESDLFNQLHPKEKYQLIVSNPPYIPTKEIEGLEEEVRSHDPVLALDGGEEGMYFYRQIIGQSTRYLVEGGVLMMECGWNQGEEISQMMKENGFDPVRIIKDLNGLDRVIVGNK